MRCTLAATAATVALLSLGTGQVAVASPVTWVYQGQLGWSGRPDALPVGSPVSLTLAFDSSAPDWLPADPACGVYQGTATTTVAGLTYSGSAWYEVDRGTGCGRPAGAMYVIGVGPQGPPIPYPPSAIAPPPGGIPASRLYLESGLYGPGDGLPTTPPLSMFYELYFAQIPCGNYCQGDPSSFTVTSYLAPVPEPLSAALLGAGFAAFLFRRRRSTREP